MSLDADVAAVLNGSRAKVRGILRLPARPPPTYSTIAARQPTPATQSNRPSQPAQPAAPTAAGAAAEPAWQAVPMRRRLGGRDVLLGGVEVVGVEEVEVADVEAVGEEEESGADAGRRRRRKKKAGEPPPPGLQFAELLDAQLRRAEAKLNKATPTTDPQPDSKLHPPAAPTSEHPSTSAAPSPSAAPPAAASKRARPTRLKRQMRQQQLTAFIRDRILAPIVRAAVAQATEATGGERVQGCGAGEAAKDESMRRERERREKKRMLRHVKRKQKRIDKHANDEQPASQSFVPTQPAVSASDEWNGAADEEAKQEQDDVGDESAAAGAEALLPLSQPVDANEDPSCPTHPYAFTAEERAFLFQHVVVDRYHSQPPLTPLVSALCQQLFTPAVDTPVAHLLLALASYQRRALSSPSPLVRARGRRFVLGLREATKRLKQNRLQLLILPHNVETTHPELATQLATLYFSTHARSLPIVWSLSRRRLASCCGTKGRAAVVAITSTEGCSDLLRTVKERAGQAQEGWAVRGWDAAVEAGVRERREREGVVREEARLEWLEREAEVRREERKKDKARLEKELEEANKRDEQLRQKQAERRVEQQRQAALQRSADQQKEQQRLADDAIKHKQQQRQQQQQQAKAATKAGLDQQRAGQGEAAGGGVGKRTWLDEAVDGKEGGLDGRVGSAGDGGGRGGGKQGKVKGKAATGKGIKRR